MDERNKDVRKSVIKNEIKAEAKHDSKEKSEKSDKSTEKSEKSDQGILDTGAELKRALEAWNDLAAQAPAPSADEKLLHDVQHLLKQLKSKIEEFK
jgi:hypothetical protein